MLWTFERFISYPFGAGLKMLLVKLFLTKNWVLEPLMAFSIRLEFVLFAKVLFRIFAAAISPPILSSRKSPIFLLSVKLLAYRARRYAEAARI